MSHGSISIPVGGGVEVFSGKERHHFSSVVVPAFDQSHQGQSQKDGLQHCGVVQDWSLAGGVRANNDEEGLRRVLYV